MRSVLRSAGLISNTKTAGSFHSIFWIASSSLYVLQLRNGSHISKLQTRAFGEGFKKVYDVTTGLGNAANTFMFLTREIQKSQLGTVVKTNGYLVKKVFQGKKLAFARMCGAAGLDMQVQLVIRDPEMVEELRNIQLHSPICVTGVWRAKQLRQSSEGISQSTGSTASPSKMEMTMDQVEVEVHTLTCFNDYPLHVGEGQSFAPKFRYLQIRHDEGLRSRLRLRSEIASQIRKNLDDWQEVETPILFKSTPEGAKEFLVPSRKLGHAYALPQSPQQYKQILMASGIEKYYQFARCFRDEDLRADRQPEFTQLDLEIAFASGEDVMKHVERLIKQIYSSFAKVVPPIAIGTEHEDSPDLDVSFPRISYDHAMSRYGSDKPDLRIKGLIMRLDEGPGKHVGSMLTSIENPLVEVWKFRSECSMTPGHVKQFITQFMESPVSEPFRLNPDGAPGFAILDEKAPLSGLQIFGFEGASHLRQIYSSQERCGYLNTDVYQTDLDLDESDLFILQARRNLPHDGGSTMLGKLRVAIYNFAAEKGLIEQHDTHHYLWVTDFPMFTCENADDPGQGGQAGFSATHHPFTAPRSIEDFDLMMTNPLKAKADHYDLVVNGIELGGGSRRIHSAEVQHYVMKHVLQMSDERIENFSHLLDALLAGCPPHAGFALGFDRFMALLTRQESVRDVIAFPKSSKGDDIMVKSPSRMSNTDLKRYGLRLEGEFGCFRDVAV